MSPPSAVIALANGDDGEFRGAQGYDWHATLYALDAQTGRMLYLSRDLIKSFSHFGGLIVGGGTVYVGTDDGTVHVRPWPNGVVDRPLDTDFSENFLDNFSRTTVFE